LKHMWRRRTHMPLRRKSIYDIALSFILTVNRFVKGSVNELRKEVPITGELDDTAIEDAVCRSDLSESFI
jgi:hypothetical protein